MGQLKLFDMPEAAENPCKDAVDLWVNNVFPDIALQGLGTRLLASALALVPQLNDPEEYHSMPGVGDDKWDPAQVQPENCHMRGLNYLSSLNLICDRALFADAVERIAADLRAARVSQGGIVRGTVRVWVSYVGGTLINVALLWMELKHD